MLFYWYQSYHWYQRKPFLSPLTPMDGLTYLWVLNNPRPFIFCLFFICVRSHGKVSRLQWKSTLKQSSLTVRVYSYWRYQTKAFDTSKHNLFVLFGKVVEYLNLVLNKTCTDNWMLWKQRRLYIAVMRLAGVLDLTSRSPGAFQTCCRSPRMFCSWVRVEVGFSRSEFRFVRTERLSNFVTHSYNRK